MWSLRPWTPKTPTPSVSALTPSPPVVAPSPGEYKSDISCDGRKYSRDELDTAALYAVDSMLPSAGNFAGFSELQLWRALTRIDDIGKWALTIPDTDVRDAYIHWLNYKATNVRNDIESLQQSSVTVEEGEWSKTLAKLNRARALSKCLPKQPIVTTPTRP